SNLTAYMRWLADKRGLHFADYDALWRWSVSELETFWVTIAEYFDVKLHKPYHDVLSSHTMPGAKWFDGAEINYAEHVFRRASDQRPALIFRSETQGTTETPWPALRDDTARIAAQLRAWGIERGDRVVAFMPNIPQTVEAFLAAASIGATWSSCSPDFGIGAVVDRFAQIEPRVLFAVDGYTYGGKPFDRRDVLAELLKQLPTVEHVILLPYLDPNGSYPNATPWADIQKGPAPELKFTPVPFDHPLWILYSSGTTGLPKGIVHPTGGVVLEQLKCQTLHCDLHPGDRLFWQTSTGWMMWNFVMGGLLTGATAVLYDGNPGYPTMDVLWEYAEQARISVFGTSAAYITACLKAGISPGSKYDLSALASIGSTGSPLTVEGFAWIYEHVKKDVWLASISGGTDVVTGFVGGVPTLPVYAGELQRPMLGCKLEAFDENGNSVVGPTGELVITEPMPSMPVFFWNDPDGQRYHDAYFDMYPGIWRHGDWIRFNERGGSVIEGRSDSTLNRLGVRMGSAEIYAVVESIPEVTDSLVIGVEQPDGGYYMPLFVTVANAQPLSEDIVNRIKTTLRTTLSPRHVPDEIVAVPVIPRTLSGKKMEVPVKKLYQGVPLAKAANVGATTDPQALRHFEELARARSSAR
ncbi:MAG: acetoacetate--CoA ligase, partial [Chloroflexi bacterium]|nr:acetoacetate--CoA ligase [Chloroflexota bacterium]